MEKVIFNVEERSAVGGNNPKRLRRDRKVPGVVYGTSFANKSVEVALVPLEKLFYTAGEGTIIQLVIGDEKPVDVIIQNVDFHVITNEISHIDFMAVNPNQKISVTVPINFVGESDAVRLGGMFVVNKSEIEIDCLVKNIVHDLQADISLLKEVGDHLSVGNIDLPEGVTLKLDDKVMIAHVEQPKVRIVETDAPEGVVDEEAEGEGEESKEA